MATPQAYIVDALRSPTGKRKGSLAHVHGADLGAHVIRALVERGHTVLPSQTNFLLVDLGRDAADFERGLFEHGVIVRPMGGYGLGHTVRISIGSRIENQRLLDALP